MEIESIVKQMEESSLNKDKKKPANREANIRLTEDIISMLINEDNKGEERNSIFK